ncbi:zinc finger, CCHC-type containing protein [Tanacetum coccineum]|uniref:Zinc finger, CCHC-type containing protein n=1 Tax=Tanacetum coccineum TaxID=301880 RepID=A0ABQ5HII9_9ASTR
MVSKRTMVVLVPTRNLNWNVRSVAIRGIAVVETRRIMQMLVVRERVDAIALWIDSGATTHVFNARCWFKTYEPVEDGSVLYTGDDHFAPVHGKGSVVLEFSFGKSINLFNVLYVPKLLFESSLGYAGTVMPNDAVKVFDEMLERSGVADEYSYSYVISACAPQGRLKGIRVRSIMGGFCCGGVGDARRVFEEMGKRSLVTWNTLLAGYVKCGDIDGARRVFGGNGGENVLCLGRRLVSGCVALMIGDLKMGEMIHCYIDRSLDIIKQNRTVRIDIMHFYSCTVSWTTMISGFGKQGRGEDALSVFQLMESTKDKHSKPDAITLLVVLDACRWNKDAAILFYYLMFMQWPKRWERCCEVREKMVVGTEKPLGKTQLGANRWSVHAVLSDDRTHIHASLIYEMLHLVTVEASLTGYKPDIYEAAQPYGTR